MYVCGASTEVQRMSAKGHRIAFIAAFPNVRLGPVHLQGALYLRLEAMCS